MITLIIKNRHNLGETENQSKKAKKGMGINNFKTVGVLIYL